MENNGWPDSKQPGIPLNPERGMWHWIQWTPNVGAPCYWNTYKWADEEWGMRAAECKYLGPCLSPSEVSVISKTSFNTGVEAMRQAAARRVHTDIGEDREVHLRQWLSSQIRAISVSEPTAPMVSPEGRETVAQALCLALGQNPNEHYSDKQWLFETLLDEAEAALIAAQIKLGQYESK